MGGEKEEVAIAKASNVGAYVVLLYVDGGELRSPAYNSSTKAMVAATQHKKLHMPREKLVNMFDWSWSQYPHPGNVPDEIEEDDFEEEDTEEFEEDDDNAEDEEEDFDEDLEEDEEVEVEIEEQKEEIMEGPYQPPFKLPLQVKTLDVCSAMRCTEEDIVEKGAATLWGRPGEQVVLCQRHSDMLAEARKKYEKEQRSMKNSIEIVNEVDEAEEDDSEAENNSEAEAKLYVAAVLAEAEEALEVLEDYEPETQDDLQAIADLMNETRDKLVRLEGLRKKVTKELDELLNSARALFRPAERKLEAVVQATKRILGKYEMQEAERNRALRAETLAAQDAGDSKRASEALARMHSSRKLEGVTSYQKWDYKVVNFKALSDDWKLPNHKALRELCNHSTKEEPPAVEGVKFFPKLPTIVAKGKKR